MQKCNYCKEQKEYVEKIDDNTFICDSCKEIVNKESKIVVKKKNRNMLTPLQIKKELDKYIIKQNDAKTILATEAYNHIKRCNIKELSNIEKNNVLLIGPSGCGKTYLVETLAKILDIPFVSVNATEFTAAGYVGKNISQIGKELFDKAKGDIKLAEKGIVFIDEIDKIAGFADKYTGKDVGGLEVQKELLKVIEGEELVISDGDEFFDDIPEESINTKNILFIFSGAFEYLKTKEEKVQLLANNTKENDVEITNELLIENGFLREFIGRIPIIIELEKLEIDDIVNILTKAENNLISQYTKMFAYDNLKLEFSDDAVYEIAKMSYDKNIGARGLKSIMGNIMNKILYQTYEKKITEIKVTKEKIVSLIKKNDKSIRGKI